MKGCPEFSQEMHAPKHVLDFQLTTFFPLHLIDGKSYIKWWKGTLQASIEDLTSTMRLGLVLISSLLCQSCSATNYLEERTGGSSKVMTRKRRFAIPSQTGWSFATSFSLTFPLQGLDTSFTGSVPFSYSFNLTG
jgi:hypothetical protein